MKKINCSVVFPEYFCFEVEDEDNWNSLDREEKRNRIKNYAAYLLECWPSDPVIMGCSEDELVEGKE